MDFLFPLASFFWDPPREAFVVPFIDRPVFWYGILFVTGFVLGYFVINPFFSRFLNRSHHISKIDLIDPTLFIENLRKSRSPLALSLRQSFTSSTTKELLKEEITHSSPTLQFLNRLLAEINLFLKNAPCSREQIAPIFGSGLAPSKQTAYFLGDRLCWFAIAGTIIGARLGEVFFYNWAYYSAHPLEIFKTWEGGLASHGGVLGVVVALFLYWKYIHQWVPELTFLRLLDFVAVPSALVATFIRLGNFMNQEILGTATTLPWGILFGHPEGGGASQVIRHPVQLYEALAYFITFLILWAHEKKQTHSAQGGGTIGLLFILIFGSRFILEFWKSFQPSSFDLPFLQMGQILSLPFIFAGYLLWRNSKKTIVS